MTTKGNGRVLRRGSYWWIAYYVHGQEQREVARHPRTGQKLESTKANLHEARRYLKHRVGQVVAEKHGGPAFVGPAQQRLSVNDLLDALRDDYQLRGKWDARVASTIKLVREHFGLWKAGAVTSKAVASFQVGLREKGYRDATINRFCQILGQAYKMAIENKHLSGEPVIKHLSEVGNERKGFFTEGEIRTLIACLPEYLRDFVLFAYITGMRRGEVQGLRWSDVHGDTITLCAADSKNGEGRTIPLVGELGDLIERRRAARQLKNGDTVMLSDFVFHRNGAPIASFRKAWATACKFANVPGRLFHDLRRCAARNLLAAGVPQAVAMKITGHRTDSMFRRYAIVTVDQQREALQAAAAYRQQQVKVEGAKVTTIN